MCSPPLLMVVCLALLSLLPPSLGLIPRPPLLLHRQPESRAFPPVATQPPDECDVSGASGILQRCSDWARAIDGPLEWSRTVLPPLAALVLTDRALRAVPLGVPPQLAGMLGGFALLCCTQACSPALAEATADFFAPGCRLLSTWLAAIFAPAFITLPATMPALAIRELALFLGLCAAGFVSSTVTNSLLFSAIQRLRWGGLRDSDSNAPPNDAVATPPAKRSNPFPLVQKLCLAAVTVAGVTSHLLSFGPSALLDVSLLSITLLAFSVASSLSPRFNIIVHPFLTTSGAVMAFCSCVAAATSQSWLSLLSRYQHGAGRLLLSLMGPTVISLAFQLFSYRKQLAANALTIIGVGVGGAACGMTTSVLSARLLGLDYVLRVSLLCRSTTTALAGEVARLVAVEPGLGMLSAFATGLFGIWFGVRSRFQT